MATTITIQTGPLTRSMTWQNDAKAQAALLAFALQTGVDPAATNAQKLDWVIARLAQLVVAGGIESRAREIAGDAVATAQGELGFE